MAFLKHDMETVAGEILRRELGHSVSRGVHCDRDTPADGTLEAVWRQLRGTDSAWKLCFWSNGRPEFDFLSRFLRSTFPIESQNYYDYYMINFDAMYKCLCLDLLGEDVLLDSREWFELVTLTDAPDEQELLMALHYCKDERLILELVQQHQGSLASKPFACKELQILMRTRPFLQETIALSTLLKVYKACCSSSSDA